MTLENTEISVFPRFEGFVQELIEFIVILIDLISVFIIAVSVLIAFIYFVKYFKKILDFKDPETHTIRIRLGKMLLIGLDVLIAADLLRTVVKQTLIELLGLAVIVGIRIVLTWILSKETGSDF